MIDKAKHEELLVELGRVAPAAATWLRDAINRHEHRVVDSSCLSGSIMWYYTPQGYDYWEKISDKLPVGME